MNRFASPIVKVIYDGPDVQEQKLFETFRPYGRIKDIVVPTIVPAGAPRAATITFHKMHSATTARNVLYGVDLQSQPTATTRIRTVYQKPIQVHAIRDWMSSHPKIMLPLLVFLLGTLTYTVSQISHSVVGPEPPILTFSRYLIPFVRSWSKGKCWIGLTTAVSPCFRILRLGASHRQNTRYING